MVSGYPPAPQASLSSPAITSTLGLFIDRRLGEVTGTLGADASLHPLPAVLCFPKLLFPHSSSLCPHSGTHWILCLGQGWLPGGLLGDTPLGQVPAVMLFRLGERIRGLCCSLEFPMLVR